MSSQHSNSHMDLQLAYLHLTLAYYKIQGQGHTQSDCEYLANYKIYGYYYYYHHIESRIWVFRLAYLHLFLAHCKGQSQGQGHGHAYFDCVYLLAITSKQLNFETSFSARIYMSTRSVMPSNALKSSITLNLVLEVRC